MTMKRHDGQLLTPIFLKTAETMEWPREENAFYVLSRDGLFLCRNHPLYRSCVPTDQWPGELEGQKPFLKLTYPRIPRPLLERIVGFFHIMAERASSEAAVLLAWDRRARVMIPVVPKQIGRVARSWHGTRYPIDLTYECPPLPPHWMLIGDVHSHVDGPAYASGTDVSDEKHRPGLHLVVGRIYDALPEFHAEITVDGYRFRLKDLDMVLEGFAARRPHEVPEAWIQQVTVTSWSGSMSATTGSVVQAETHPGTREQPDDVSSDPLPAASPAADADATHAAGVNPPIPDPAPSPQTRNPSDPRP